MHRDHHYALQLRWTGNRGTGTADYNGYGRDHELAAAGKPTLLGSADKTFRGDAARWNPEEMLVAALASCHMLAFLHVAVLNGVVVSAYSDEATGTMQTAADGSGRFTEVVLRPVVTVADGTSADVDALHHEAHRLCFIANSVNFPVRTEATVSYTRLGGGKFRGTADT
jgi:organic hydroperoxide reductase OsmC/OhrA